ncbi:MAG: NAD(P)/FAD-dependent oxidoreductase [Pseudomonadota bacterium]
MDIAIAGAGIAGLTAAILLRRQDHKVVLFDQLEASSPVGSGLMLQPTGQAVLKALGLLGDIERLGARINRLHGQTSPGNRTVLDVRFSPLGEDVHAIAIHRAALFDVLQTSAVSAGALFEQGRVVQSVDDGVIAFQNGRRSGKFDLVIDALGVRSPLGVNGDKFLDYGALWANLPWPDNGFDEHALEQRYKAARRMAGVLPIGRLAGDPAPLTAFFWSLRHDHYNDWRRNGLDVWKEEALALWPETKPFLDAIHDMEQLIFARYAHHTMKNPVRRNLVHIGDSYHAASPQLGQGANMAMLDAYALAQAISEQPDTPDALASYSAKRSGHIRLYQAISWLFTPVYQSDSKVLPWLRDVIAAPLSRIPPAPYLLASMVAGTLGGPLAKLKLSASLAA